MNRTPTKALTPTKNFNRNSKSPIKQSSSKLSLSQSKDNLCQDPYFCHYRNAVYMGRTKVFQRDGKGILLHDDGSSAVTSCQKDMLHGYSLILTCNDFLISAHYNKNRLMEVAYKTDNILFYGRFNAQQQLDGSSTLINYEKKQIIYANAKKGHIIDKYEEKSDFVLGKVFSMGNLQGIIPIEHIKQLNLDLEKSRFMEIIRRGSKVTIGFTKNGLLNGLGIVFGQRVQEQQGRNFHYQLIERGFYKNQQLYGLGERRFKNGNVYVGQFKNDLFQGLGILKNNQKVNWVSGQFERGNLIQLGKYSNDGKDHNPTRILQLIHQKKTSWVNKQVSLTNAAFIDRELERILRFKKDQQMTILETRRQQMLRRIQDNFLGDADSLAQVEEISSSRRFQGLPESRLQKFLKTDPANTSLEGHQQRNQSSSFQSKMFNSSRRNQQTSPPHEPSFQNQFKSPPVPKTDPYYLKVFPVPLDDSHASNKQQVVEHLVLSKSYRVTQSKKDFQANIASFRNQSKRSEIEQENSSSQMRDSKTLVGPRVQIFTPQKNYSIENKKPNRSSHIGLSTSEMNRRQQNILESMHRRQLKKSLF